MAILTAAELKASREAIDADVDGASPADMTLAISEAEATLYSTLGYPVADASTSVTGYGDGEGHIYLPRRARTISSVTEDGVTIASTGYYISGSGFLLKRGRRGYMYRDEDWPEPSHWYPNSVIVVTGTFGYATTDDKYILAKKAVRLLAIQGLSSSDGESNMPNGPAGASLTGYTAEGASFTFDTDEPQIANLIEDIGLHPLKGKNTLQSVRLST